ncbi:MAG: GDP-mannose 4,6-dehydratase [Verrucomicrobia bacterium]|nr:GDP-mannose 4,6-dehydratase [Verrucomicrobiota bacterium]
MKKRILITGAAGFIGFHFAKQCLEHGHYVVGIDNFNDYYAVSLKEDRAKELQQFGLQVERLDICDETLCDRIQQGQFTHVVHLAAQAGVRYSLDHPEVYVKTNIGGFLNVLEGCRKAKGVRLIYASSSSVYGSNTKVPFAVDDRTDCPVNMYAATKKSNELMAYTYHHLYQLPCLGMRFFTVYGPWGRPDMAVYAFTRAIFEGNPVEVYNNGASLRDFTYVDDIIDGIYSALDCPQEYAIFNLGNNRPQSVHTLMDLIEKETGKKFNKQFLPMQKGEIVETYADIATATQWLGFRPKVTLADGIAKFVAWYEEYMSLDKNGAARLV